MERHSVPGELGERTEHADRGGAADGRLIKNLRDGTVVHVIEKPSNWWLVAEVVAGNDDTTGFVHSNWLQPA